jgi:hypothetical protein
MYEGQRCDPTHMFVGLDRFHGQMLFGITLRLPGAQICRGDTLLRAKHQRPHHMHPVTGHDSTREVGHILKDRDPQPE